MPCMRERFRKCVERGATLARRLGTSDALSSLRMDENGHRTPALVKGLATVGAGFLGWVTLAALFTPRQRFLLRTALDPKSDELLKFLEATAPSQVYRGNDVEVMADGAEFYRSMVDTIPARPSGRSIWKPSS